MSAFAGHGRVMQVNDDAFDADGSGGNSKEKGIQKKGSRPNNNKEQNNRNNHSICYTGGVSSSGASTVLLYI